MGSKGYEHNMNMERVHGLMDYSYKSSGISTRWTLMGEGTDRKMRDLNERGFSRKAMAQQLFIKSHKATKPFTLRTKNVSFTFYPKKYEKSQDGLPSKMKFSVNIKTSMSEIKGATLYMKRNRRTRSKRGKTLPVRAQKDLNTYFILFDFPKTKKRYQVYSTFEGHTELVDKEDYGYVHPHISNAENIEKTMHMIMEIICVDWEKVSKGDEIK